MYEPNENPENKYKYEWSWSCNNWEREFFVCVCGCVYVSVYTLDKTVTDNKLSNARFQHSEADGWTQNAFG